MNEFHTILDILVGVAALAVALVVGRDNIKKRTIAELQDLVEVLTGKIDDLQKTVATQRDKIVELTETVDGYAELVREGYLSGLRGTRSGNRTATPKTTKNRTP